MASEFLMIASSLGFAAAAFLGGFLSYISLGGFKQAQWRGRVGMLMLAAAVILLLGVNFTVAGLVLLSAAQTAVLANIALLWIVDVPLAVVLVFLGYLLRRSGQQKWRKR